MLAISLSQSFMVRQKVKKTDAFREAASFVGGNKKIVRKYRKEFFTHGRFLERQGIRRGASILGNAC